MQLNYSSIFKLLPEWLNLYITMWFKFLCKLTNYTNHTVSWLHFSSAYKTINIFTTNQLSHYNYFSTSLILSVVSNYPLQMYEQLFILVINIIKISAVSQIILIQFHICSKNTNKTGPIANTTCFINLWKTWFLHDVREYNYNFF